MEENKHGEWRALSGYRQMAVKFSRRTHPPDVNYVEKEIRYFSLLPFLIRKAFFNTIVWTLFVPYSKYTPYANKREGAFPLYSRQNPINGLVWMLSETLSFVLNPNRDILHRRFKFVLIFLLDFFCRLPPLHFYSVYIYRHLHSNLSSLPFTP